MSEVFFVNDTGTTEIYTLSLHDALPISGKQSSAVLPPRIISPWIARRWRCESGRPDAKRSRRFSRSMARPSECWTQSRSEEHTSELQSRQYLVCRLLLEKKKKTQSL